MPGRIVPVFEKTLTATRDVAESQAAAALGTSRRRWYLNDRTLWAGDVSNPAAIEAGFDRSAADADYVAALNEDGGTLGAAGAAKVQADYVAAAERAFRLRHLSPARALLHAGARRRGHGDQAGVFGRVLRFAEELVAAGATDPAPEARPPEEAP